MTEVTPDQSQQKPRCGEPSLLLNPQRTTGRLVLTSPTAMPRTSAFLWNRVMLFQANCRGFATAQLMQPEPANNAHAPNWEASTLMQPALPSHWDSASIVRDFRGGRFHIGYRRDAQRSGNQILLNDKPLGGHVVATPEPGSEHRVDVIIGTTRS